DRHVRVAIDTIPLQVRAHFPLNVGVVHRPSVRPEIAFVAPSSLHEGETAAILLTGKNFVPGRRTVQFLDEQGQVEPRIDVRSTAVTADGTKLGIALKVGVMTDFGEGTTRTLTVKVLRQREATRTGSESSVMTNWMWSGLGR